MKLDLSPEEEAILKKVRGEMRDEVCRVLMAFIMEENKGDLDMMINSVKLVTPLESILVKTITQILTVMVEKAAENMNKAEEEK